MLNEFDDDDYRMAALGTVQEDVIFDIGANLGLFTLTAGMAFARPMVAFEAQPLNFLLLVHSVVVNGLAQRVRAFNRAIASRPGIRVPIGYNQTNPCASTARCAGQD